MFVSVNEMMDRFESAIECGELFWKILEDSQYNYDDLNENAPFDLREDYVQIYHIAPNDATRLSEHSDQSVVFLPDYGAYFWPITTNDHYTRWIETK